MKQTDNTEARAASFNENGAKKGGILFPILRLLGVDLTPFGGSSQGKFGYLQMTAQKLTSPLAWADAELCEFTLRKQLLRPKL